MKTSTTKKTKKIVANVATIVRDHNADGSPNPFPQALDAYTRAAVTFSAIGQALPGMLADRSAAQNTTEREAEAAYHRALDELHAVIDQHTADAVAAALAAL